MRFWVSKSKHEKCPISNSCNGTGFGRCTYLEKEWVGVGSEFFEQSLLKIGESGWSLKLWEDLLLCYEEVFAKCKAKHVEIVAAIAKCGKHVCEHFAFLDIVRVDEHYAVWRFIACCRTRTAAFTDGQCFRRLPMGSMSDL